MSASLSLDGVKEIREALERLPEQLTRDEFGPIVRASAEGLAGELKSSYARVTGTLADRVVVEPGRSGNGLMAKVRSKAPHAHLYEYGTVRRRTNETGANRGSMPARPIFVPAAIRARERMVRACADAFRRLKIPGFSGTPEVRES